MVATAVPTIVQTIVSQDMAGIGVKARFADASFTNASPRYLSYGGITEKFAGGVLATRRISGRLYAQIELQSISLLPYCDKFDEANWNTNELTLVDEAETTPHTDFDAWSLTPTAVSSTHTLYDTYNVDGSSQYCWSGIFKANGYNFVLLRLGEPGFVGSPFAYFNLSTGAVGNSGGVDTVGIDDYGNGWYRCFISALSNAAADGEPLIAACDQDYNLYTPTSFSGDTTSGVLCCHTQLEKKYYPSSLIKTVAAQVTRNSDDLYFESASVPIGLRGNIIINLIPYWAHTVSSLKYILSYTTVGERVTFQYQYTVDRFRVYDVDTPQTLVQSNAAQFTRNSNLIATLKPSDGQVELQGATVGNGLITGISWATTTGNVYYGGNGTYPWDGLISEPY